MVAMVSRAEVAIGASWPAVEVDATRATVEGAGIGWGVRGGSEGLVGGGEGEGDGARFDPVRLGRGEGGAGRGDVVKVEGGDGAGVEAAFGEVEEGLGRGDVPEGAGDFGEGVVAIIVAKKNINIDPDALIAFAKEKLANYNRKCLPL